MKNDFALLLVDSASNYTRNDGKKRRIGKHVLYVGNDCEHDEKTIKHNSEIKAHDLQKNIYNDRLTMQFFLAERFSSVEIFMGYVGKKDIRKLKMDHDIKLEHVQDVLEEIKTLGYMYTYVMPVFDREAIGYEELMGEIEERVSFGCFSDIVLVEADGIISKDIENGMNVLDLCRLADRFEEVMR